MGTSSKPSNNPPVAEPTSYFDETSFSPDPDKHHFTTQSRPRRMSAHAEADAARAMHRTNSWTPALVERRQSFSKEDHKHAMQMASLEGSGHGGFSER